MYPFASHPPKQPAIKLPDTPRMVQRVSFMLVLLSQPFQMISAFVAPHGAPEMLFSGALMMILVIGV